MQNSRIDHKGSLVKVSANGRYLEKDSKPFIWIGDTAWELFHRLSRKEAEHYLAVRKKQGFSVIQAVLLAEIDGLQTPNANGDLPLEGLSPQKPNEAYFQHVDAIVNQAEKLGLQMALLPTWGDKLETSIENDIGPKIFRPDNSEAYGRFLGRRYRGKPVIWILGGDRNIDSQENLLTWRAMAQGLRDGGDGRHLISYHPRGGQSSSTWLHHESWLDFNMYQSGHEKKYNDVYEFADHCHRLSPVKPFVEGEPAYEDIPVRFWEYLDFGKIDPVPSSVLNQDGLIQDASYFDQGFFTDKDVRVHAYWNLLSGACGYTYGNNAVWQMHHVGMPVLIPCLHDWQDSLHRPGAEQMIHLRRLWQARPFHRLKPDPTLVFGPNPKGKSHVRAATADDGSFALAYCSCGQSVTIQPCMLKGQESVAWWFDPRQGTGMKAAIVNHQETITLTPPQSKSQDDYLLVLDSLSSDLEPVFGR